jgi:DNA-binding PadR family transcriptional regulator
MSTPSRDPAAYLPLSSAMFHVLVSLAGDEQHGYAIIKDIASRTDGTVTLSTGTLYGIIKRLLADGLIVESRTRPAAADDDERRRYYRLTPLGRRVAVAEAERLEQMVEVARGIRLLRERRTQAGD